MTRTTLLVSALVLAMTSAVHADGTTITRRDPDRVLTAKVIAGIGGASLFTSWILGYTAKVNYDKATRECDPQGDSFICPPDAYSRTVSARAMGDVGTGFLIGGLVLGAAALIVYVTAPRETVVVTPVATSDGGGVSLVGRF